MSESYMEIVTPDGTVRESGSLSYPQATPANVLTVQNDGTIAAAAAGGAPTAPYTSPADADVTVLQDATDVALVAGGAGTGGVRLGSTDGNSSIAVTGSGISAFIGVGSTIALSPDPGAAFVAGDDGAGATTIGFFGATPAAKPSVANATAADILAALVTLGLVTDAT